MKELVKRLTEVVDCYDDFILGVINYAKEKPEHVDILLDYFNNNAAATSSDVIYFIMTQPDFFDICVQNKVG